MRAGDDFFSISVSMYIPTYCNSKMQKVVKNAMDNYETIRENLKKVIHMFLSG
jgi:hypothetical protein